MAKYANWYKVNLSLGMDNADLANADAVIVAGICPLPGTIKQVWVGGIVLPTAGTCALAKGSTNILTATNVNLASGISVGVAASQTLAAGAGALRVAAGNMLTATWTFGTIGTGDGFAAEVWIEPDEF